MSDTTPDAQPDELTEIKKIVAEYLQRRTNVENEIQSLKEDLKSLDEEYKKKLDMKTLRAALQVLKIESKVDHKDTFDAFLEVLKSDEANGVV